MPVFVDTNVLVYAREASDPAKHQVARDWMKHLWRSESGRVSVQVLQEYYVTVTRKLDPRLSATDARADVEDLMAWSPIQIDEGVLRAGWAIEDRFRLSFWDALVVAAAQDAACNSLLTEDLQHGLDLDGLTVLDPFRTEVGSLG